jgi:hypothetical protein
MEVEEEKLTSVFDVVGPVGALIANALFTKQNIII